MSDREQVREVFEHEKKRVGWKLSAIKERAESLTRTLNDLLFDINELADPNVAWGVRVNSLEGAMESLVRDLHELRERRERVNAVKQIIDLLGEEGTDANAKSTEG